MASLESSSLESSSLSSGLPEPGGVNVSSGVPFTVNYLIDENPRKKEKQNFTSLIEFYNSETQNIFKYINNNKTEFSTEIDDLLNENYKYKTQLNKLKCEDNKLYSFINHSKNSEIPGARLASKINANTNANTNEYKYERLHYNEDTQINNFLEDFNNFINNKFVPETPSISSFGKYAKNNSFIRNKPILTKLLTDIKLKTIDCECPKDKITNDDCISILELPYEDIDYNFKTVLYNMNGLTENIALRYIQSKLNSKLGLNKISVNTKNKLYYLDIDKKAIVFIALINYTDIHSGDTFTYGTLIRVFFINDINSFSYYFFYLSDDEKDRQAAEIIRQQENAAQANAKARRIKVSTLSLRRGGNRKIKLSKSTKSIKSPKSSKSSHKYSKNRKSKTRHLKKHIYKLHKSSKRKSVKNI